MRCDQCAERLIAVTREALAAGIAQARNGHKLGDLSAAIGDVCHAAGFTVNTDFGGHGVGRCQVRVPLRAHRGGEGHGHPRLRRGDGVLEATELAGCSPAGSGSADVRVGRRHMSVFTARLRLKASAPSVQAAPDSR